jgi:hypothetical protein
VPPAVLAVYSFCGVRMFLGARESWPAADYRE